LHNLLIYNRYARLSTLYGATVKLYGADGKFHGANGRLVFANVKADRTDDRVDIADGRFDAGVYISRKPDDIAHGINNRFYEIAARFYRSDGNPKEMDDNLKIS